jgi:hypothetical protein
MGDCSGGLEALIIRFYAEMEGELPLTGVRGGVHFEYIEACVTPLGGLSVLSMAASC